MREREWGSRPIAAGAGGGRGTCQERRRGGGVGHGFVMPEPSGRVRNCAGRRISAVPPPAVRFAWMGAGGGRGTVRHRHLSRFGGSDRGARPGVGQVGDGGTGAGSGQGQVVGGLEVEPEFGGGAEPVGEAQRGVGGDGSLAVDDLGDAVGGHGELAGELGGGGGGGGEALGEDLAGVRGRGAGGGGHGGDRAGGKRGSPQLSGGAEQSGRCAAYVKRR